MSDVGDRKDDWSFLEEIHAVERARGEPHRDPEREVPSGLAEQAILDALVAPINDERLPLLREEAHGLVTRFRERSIRQEAALAGVRKVMAAQLEVLDHYLANAVQVKRSRLDVEVKEFLAALDAEHIRLLNQFDVRNLATRAKTLAELSETYLAAVRDMRDRNWPPSMLSETLAALNAIRIRIATQVAEDFPSRYGSAGAMKGN